MTKTATRSSLYAWYVLFVLFIVNAFNAVDRSMVNILVEPIRQEFGFSDGQIGLLSGIGFAFFYAVLGIPIARLADKRNRRNILAIGVALWSGLTALTGQATGFFTFLLARAGVGVGEATCFPTAYPLISDYFAKHRRPLAMAIFQMGVFAGIVVGSILTGRIAAAHGWRAAFAFIGLPGIVVALVVFLTIKEPVRGGRDEPVTGQPDTSGIIDVLRLLLGDRRFLLLILATTCLTTASAMMSGWGAAFLMRLHDVSQGDVGIVSLPSGLAGMVGTIGGGVIGSHLAKRSDDHRAPLKAPLAVSLIAVPGTLLFIFAPTVPLTMLGGALGALGIALHTGPTLAVLIGLVRPQMRGMASAIVVFGHLLIGYGMGPVIVGLLSDALVPTLGGASLRGALTAAPVLVVAGWLCLRAAYRAIGRAEQSADPASGGPLPAAAAGAAL